MNTNLVISHASEQGTGVCRKQCRADPGTLNQLKSVFHHWIGSPIYINCDCNHSLVPLPTIYFRKLARGSRPYRNPGALGRLVNAPQASSPDPRPDSSTVYRHHSPGFVRCIHLNQLPYIIARMIPYHTAAPTSGFAWDFQKRVNLDPHLVQRRLKT